MEEADRGVRITHAIKASNVDKSRARILVVDDEPVVAETIRSILANAGFRVETAENGKRALDLLGGGHPFDLIIADMKMPEMGGLELLKLIRQLREDLPVIILTGWATVENGIESIEMGACDYVLKPFTVERLMSAVIRSMCESRPDLKSGHGHKKKTGETS
jgi:two-component system response regulator AtoC